MRTSLCPVLDHEARNSLKLADVVGDEDQPGCECLSGDQQIHGANRLAPSLERLSDDTVLVRGSFVEGEDLERREELR